MIVVTVTLKSAISEARDHHLGTMTISNTGEYKIKTPTLCDYLFRIGRGKEHDLKKIHEKPSKTGKIENHARHSYSVWVLVKKCLNQAYGV